MTRPQLVLRSPWTDAMDVLDLDMRNISCWCIVRQKFCPRSYVDLGELVQQFRCATFRHSSASRDHQIVVQVVGFSTGLHRQRHTRTPLSTRSLRYATLHKEHMYLGGNVLV